MGIVKRFMGHFKKEQHDQGPVVELESYTPTPKRKPVKRREKRVKGPKGPKPETAYSPMHRAKAEAKRERRRQRRIDEGRVSAD
jgi:hypothetical protein